MAVISHRPPHGLPTGLPTGFHGRRPKPTTSPLAICRVLANPRGYVDLRKDGAFNPAPVVEIAQA